MNGRDSEARVSNRASPSAWRNTSPLGYGNTPRYTRSGCQVAERPVSQGCSQGLPVARIGARDTRYRPACHRNDAPDSGCTALSLSRGARTVPPMPVASCLANRSERAPHQWTMAGHGERLTRQRSRLTALGSCGESPNDAAVSVLRALRVLRHGHAGSTVSGPQGDGAQYLNDLARQGDPSI